MDSRYLQSFVTVADLGSITEAGKHLNMTAAAVAARIHGLERELGTVLIQRSGRYVRPTETGLRVLERARGLLREVRDFHALTAADVPVGELRLGIFGSALTAMFPPVLGRLYRRLPTLSVLVVPGNSIDLCRQVMHGEIDAAVVVEPQFPLGKDCSWQTLLEEPLVVVAPQALGDRQAHDLLANEPFIRYDRSVLGGQLADRYLRATGISVQQRMEINSLMSVASLVHEGVGVALLPDWAPMWQSGWAISRIPLPGRAPIRRVGMAWATHGPRAALAEAVRDEACLALGVQKP